jgi:hypothetical protein
MSDRIYSRRDALKRVSLTVLAAGAWGVAGCGKKEVTCTDTTGLTADEVTARKTLEYTDKSPDPSKTCSVCLQFNPGAPNQCGGCKVLKGTVHPNGYCKVWAAKPA